MIDPFIPELGKFITNWLTKKTSAVSHPSSDPADYAAGKRMCRFCFDEEDEDFIDADPEALMRNADDEWLSPCLCSGSMQWVHRRCLEEWFKTVKRNQCQTCKFNFKRQWKMRPIRNWCRPNVALSVWDVVEIILDGASTYRMIKGFQEVYQGRGEYFLIFRQFLRVIIWRTVMITDSRIAFYRNLCYQLFYGVADCRVLNCDKHLDLLNKRH
uniref:RING-CH-type domain-containing protein n=1 Tax=Plectus sambesii TaxID=2011161 RepID=A0A914X0B8_9BILA